MIYMDNGATTIPHPEVLESFQQVSTSFFANPSSIHSIGGEAEKLLIRAKQQIADLLKVEESEVVFTSGGTEGNNLAIKGIALQHQHRGKHIITSTIEHPSVLKACQSLEQLGFEITYLPVDQNGVISIKKLEDSIRSDTILISIMHVNNEIGSIQPITSIGEIAKQHPKLYFHVDNVQGLGKIPLTLANSGIDLCTFSGHKIHGLKGTGMLYVNQGTMLFPLFHGGNQEYAIRSGTENLAGSVAMARAMRLIKNMKKKKKDHLYSLQQHLREGLEHIKGVKINTPLNGAPHIMNISVPSLKPEVIIHMLSEKNIYISTGSACSSKDLQENTVLNACGYNKERSISSLRISLSYDNTEEEINVLIKELEKSIINLSSIIN